jgi:hypothetical protein
VSLRFVAEIELDRRPRWKPRDDEDRVDASLETFAQPPRVLALVPLWEGPGL